MDPVELAPIFGFGLCAVAGLVFAKFSRRLGTRKALALTSVLGLAGIALLSSWQFYLRPHFGRAFEVTGLLDVDGTRLFVFHKGPRTDRTSSFRLSVLDPASGARVHREVLGALFSGSPHPTPQVEALSGRAVWLRDVERGLHARDVGTGALITTEKEIVAAYPQLGGAQAVEVNTPDGRTFRVAPPDFKVKLIAWPERKDVARDASFVPLDLKDGVIGLDAGRGISLRSDDPADPKVLKLTRVAKARYEYKAEASLSGGFREAFIVENYGLENPRSLLLGHREFDASRAKKFVLTRLGFDGQVVWEMKEEAFGGDASHFLLRNGTLFVSSGGRVTAVDPARGTVRWQARL